MIFVQMTARGKGTIESGFTLISLLIAMLLMVVVLIMAQTLFSFALKSYHTSADRIEVQENLRLGLDRLSRELRHSLGDVAINNSGSGKLSFSAVNNTSASVNNLITYRIGFSGDSERAPQLLRSVNGAGNNPIARYVTRLRVEPMSSAPNNHTYRLTITGSKGNSGELSLSTAVTIHD